MYIRWPYHNIYTNTKQNYTQTYENKSKLKKVLKMIILVSNMHESVKHSMETDNT